MKIVYFSQSPDYRAECDECNEITMRYSTSFLTRESIRGKVRRSIVKHCEQTGHRARMTTLAVQRFGPGK